ncbi:Protein CBG17097 [Caenorhabditis briggsae]|uniref:Protein CBG17097 n=1 Tax=Caenorhabditis briggsae TaxID=6238 RepID=A8XQD9_CAEBR|nr:Protein CBG17097 [Caenorhabditis briggsae]CAP34865.2 Protein CBG17097 [Caenorhabditis briggsae]
MYAKKIPSDCYNEGIRCILKQIRKYTKPESLWHWLTDAKCTVQLDEKGRITYFCSEDGTVVRESDHKKNEKRFKQELLGPHSEIIPENAKRSAIKRYSKPPENVHYWKSEPHFEHSYFEHQNAPLDGRINYDELDVKPVIFGNRCLQNSIDAKRMKIEKPEDPFADFSTDFSATSSRNIQAREALKESKISVLLLANHIETTALYFEYKNLEIQASRAVEKIKESGREMALSLREFDNFIEAMFTSIKRARIPRTESNLQLKTVFKHIKLSLIRPFGPEVTGEALKIVDKEIEELGESQDEVEVPSEVIRVNLDYLLRSSTGFWTEL